MKKFLVACWMWGLIQCAYAFFSLSGDGSLSTPVLHRLMYLNLFLGLGGVGALLVVRQFRGSELFWTFCVALLCMAVATIPPSPYMNFGIWLVSVLVVGCFAIILWATSDDGFGLRSSFFGVTLTLLGSMIDIRLLVNGPQSSYVLIAMPLVCLAGTAYATRTMTGRILPEPQAWVRPRHRPF